MRLVTQIACLSEHAIATATTLRGNIGLTAQAGLEAQSWRQQATDTVKRKAGRRWWRYRPVI
jgi:hypothetical protein